MKGTLKLIALSLMIALCFPSLAFDKADVQKLSDPKSFSMIMLGDPQAYIKCAANQPLFEFMTAWIAENRTNLNIKAVFCTGDLVETNENIVLKPGKVDQTSTQMWESVSRSFERLDNVLPYIISPGNHDYGYLHAENGNSHFGEYFNVERNKCLQEHLLSCCPNRHGKVTIENAAYLFEEPGWGKIIAICSEFAPRNEVIDWALDVCVKHKDCKVIFITHSLLDEKTAAYMDNETYYSITPANWGKAVWEKLLSKAPNIVLALCGHTGRPTEGAKKGPVDDWTLSTAYRCDKNDSGRDVHQMMFNTQVIGGWDANGGDGWLRILEFKPDGRTISVRTYSPLFSVSHYTKHLANRTGECDQFDMIVE